MKKPNPAAGLSNVQFGFGARGTAILQNVAAAPAIRRQHKVPKHAGGRQGFEELALAIFDERRRQGVPLPSSRMVEATQILQRMVQQGIVGPPTATTIRGYAGISERWKALKQKQSTN